MCGGGGGGGPGDAGPVGGLGQGGYDAGYGMSNSGYGAISDGASVATGETGFSVSFSGDISHGVPMGANMASAPTSQGWGMSVSGQPGQGPVTSGAIPSFVGEGAVPAGGAPTEGKFDWGRARQGFVAGAGLTGNPAMGLVGGFLGGVSGYGSTGDNAGYGVGGEGGQGSGTGAGDVGPRSAVSGPPAAPVIGAPTTAAPSLDFTPIPPTIVQNAPQFAVEASRSPAEIDAANRLRAEREKAYAQQRAMAELEQLKALSKRDVAYTGGVESQELQHTKASERFAGLPPALGQSRHPWA